MTNIELISKIKAEIDKRYAEYREKMKTDDFTYYEGMADALDLFEQFIDTLESKKPINPADAMKEIEEKIALVKQRGTWNGVDVDKFMDEVRGREPEKPMQEGLDEEIESYWKENGPMSHAEYDRLAKCARYFAQWQKEQYTREMIMSDGSYFQNCYELGKKDMKEQMMKEAVEGEVIKTDKHTSVRYKSFYGTDRYFYGIADKQFKAGDKVRIIIVKED